MARKVYKAGDRANVYIKKDISPEMLKFINKQSDLTMFFLYAAQQLHKQVGNVDIAEILPRKYTFSLDAQTKHLKTVPEEQQISVSSASLSQSPVESNDKTAEIRATQEEPQKTSWESLDEIEDPYA